MSENLDLVRSIYAAIGRGDYSSAEWADPEIEYVVADGPEPGSVTGWDGLVQAMRTLFSALDDLRAEAEGAWHEGALKPVELIEAGGGRVVAHGYGEMLGEASGATVAANVWSVVTFRNGKMLRIDWFADRAEALKAVGLA